MELFFLICHVLLTAIITTAAIITVRVLTRPRVKVRAELGTFFSDGNFFPFGMGLAGARKRSDGETGIAVSVENAGDQSIKLDCIDFRFGKKKAGILDASACWEGDSPNPTTRGVIVEANSVERFYTSPSRHSGVSLDSIPALTSLWACGAHRWKVSSAQLIRMKYEYFRNISPNPLKKAYYGARYWLTT